MAAAVLLLVVLRVLSRVMTFGVNQLVARSISPAEYGHATVKLQLLLDTILFLSREAIRRTALRHAAGDQSSLGDASARALAWLGIAAAPAVAYGVWLCYAGSADPAQPSGTAIRIETLFCVAACLELLSEPLFLATMRRGRFDVRLSVEGKAVAARCLATYALVVHCGWGAWGFGYGHVLYSLLLLAGYGLASPGAGRAMSPTGPRAILPEHRLLLPALAGQTLFKYALTYGEAVLMVSLQSLHDQGVFSVVNNLGSLVVRLGFQPIEEAAAISFAQTLPSAQARQQATEPAVRAAARGARLLCDYLRGMLYAGLVLACFGPPFARLLLELLHGDKWRGTDAAAVLGLYLVSVLAMAVNGMTEAFVHSAASPAELTRINVALAAFSVSYVAAAAWLMRSWQLGTRGLIIANCFNMAQRSVFSLVFISHYYRRIGAGMVTGLAGVLPPAPVLLTLALACAVCWRTGPADAAYASLAERLQHVAIGAVCFACTCACALWCDAAVRSAASAVLARRRGVPAAAAAAGDVKSE